MDESPSGADTPLGRDGREIEKAFAQAGDEEDLADAQNAAQDMQADAADFGMDEKRAATAVSLDAQTNKNRVAVAEQGVPRADRDSIEPGTPASLAGGDEEEYDEGEPGAIDEYMLRFAEWDWT